LQIHAEQVPQEDKIRIRFRDFGCGIPQEVLVHLFEPFVSTKKGGTGLGLAVSRRIVAQHGGSLTAENHPEGGALFTLELPAIDRRETSRLAAPRERLPVAVDSSSN
jgi:signal transduction histidine kinase